MGFLLLRISIIGRWMGEWVLRVWLLVFCQFFFAVFFFGNQIMALVASLLGVSCILLVEGAIFNDYSLS